MDAFQFGFFDELEKIAVVDPTLRQLSARYKKHTIPGAGTDPNASLKGFGKMSRRDMGDAIHRHTQLIRRGESLKRGDTRGLNTAIPMGKKYVSDIADIAHRQAGLDSRRKNKLPPYGMG